MKNTVFPEMNYNLVLLNISFIFTYSKHRQFSSDSLLVFKA